MMDGGYKVLNMNAGNNGRTVRSSPDTRFRKICEILSTEQPDLVIVQESSNPAELQKYLDGNQRSMISTYNVWEGTKDPSGGYQCILFNVNSLQVEQHDYNRTYRKLVDSGSISTDGEFPTRLFMRRCTSKGKPHLNLLVASYHGRKIMTDDKKALIMSELMSLLDRESAKTQLHILIGGDFNYEYKKAQDVVLNNATYQLYTAASEHKKTAGNMVDYFMYNGPQHHVHSVRVLPNNREVFDHAPLIAKINQTKSKLTLPVNPANNASGGSIPVTTVSAQQYFKCGECDHVCKTKDSLVSHKKTHISATPVSCDICGVEFKGDAVLSLHMLTHKDLTCDDCGRVCKSKAGLASHMKTHECDTGLTSHMLTHEGFACDECGRVCKNKAGLASHMKTHESDTGLTSHMLIHKGFACDECGRVCKSKAGLVSHMKTHDKPVYVSCDVCGFSCKNQAGLSSHIRTHDDLECDKCGRLCKSKAGLASHKRSHKC